MPLRHMALLATAVVVAAGCANATSQPVGPGSSESAQTPPATSPSPSRSSAPSGSAAAMLTFSGELSDMVATSVAVPPCGLTPGGFHVELEVTIAAVAYRLVMETSDYHGPGRYPAPPTRVSIHKAAIDGAPRLYTGTAGSIVVGGVGASGTVDEQLRGETGAVHVAGPWSC